MNTPASAPAPRSRNWLLTKLRNWHSQAGMIAAAFLFVVGFTGIFLNHKPFFLGLAGLEPGREMAKDKPGKAGKKSSGEKTELRLASALNGQPVSFERAVAMAQERWGNERIEKIELKEERGELSYRIKQKDGPELIISAADGEVIEKGHYEKLGRPGPDGKAARSFDWGKLALDLHTGKIVGEAGKVAMSLAGFIMLTLTATGIYLWAVPKWRKRQAARQQAAVAAAASLRPAPAAVVGAAAQPSAPASTARKTRREPVLTE